jgi:hypothetical protein
MTDIPVNIFLDIHRFEVAIDHMNENVKVAASRATSKSANAIADEVKRRLSLFPHPHDANAISPAPPMKGPVGLLTTGHGFRIRPGHLRNSVGVEEIPFTHSAKVYVDAVYARIQELGGWTGGSITLYRHMRYATSGLATGFPIVSGAYKSGPRHVYLPPRPYFRPAVMDAETIGAGKLERIYYDEWRDAMMRAIAY